MKYPPYYRDQSFKSDSWNNPWNRVEHTCSPSGQNSVNLIFRQVLHRVTTRL
jgi:hypothetical protein